MLTTMKMFICRLHWCNCGCRLVQLMHDSCVAGHSTWTNNNCETINHVLKQLCPVAMQSADWPDQQDACAKSTVNMQMLTEHCSALASTSAIKNGQNTVWLWTTEARCLQNIGGSQWKPALDCREFPVWPVATGRSLCRRRQETVRSRDNKSGQG